MGKVFNGPYGRKELIRDALSAWSIYSESYRQVRYFVDAALRGEEDGILLRGLSKDELELPYIRFLEIEAKFQALDYLKSLSDSSIRYVIRCVNELTYNYTYNTVRVRIYDNNYSSKNYKRSKYGVDPDLKNGTRVSHRAVRRKHYR